MAAEESGPSCRWIFQWVSAMRAELHTIEDLKEVLAAAWASISRGSVCARFMDRFSDLREYEWKSI